MKSIRMKLYLYFVSYLIIFVGSFIFLGSFSLEKYFLFQKKKSFEETYSVLNEVYFGINNTDILNFHKLVREQQKAVIILDSKNFNLIFNSHQPQNTQLTPPLHQHPKNKNNKNFIIDNSKIHIFRKYITEKDFLNKQTEIFTLHGKDEDFRELFYIKKLKNGDFLCLFKGIESEINTVLSMNKFSIILALTLTFITSLFLLNFTRRITKPIIILSQLSEEISQQNFNVNYIPKRKDEIGRLGEAINQISRTIKFSIDELQRDIKRKDDLDIMRKNFISNVSSELKKPIEHIKTSTNKLNKEVFENNSENEMELDFIIEETEKMDTLIKNMLNISYLESGALILNKTKFFIDDLTKNILDEYRATFKEIHLSLKTNFIHKEVNADKKQLKQAIISLIENAIKNTDDNGVINIDIETVYDKTKLSVFNSGKTIPDNEMENIWLSFYQSETIDKNNFSVNLNLAIIKSIIEEHKGEYGLKNEVNGVRFYFII